MRERVFHEQHGRAAEHTPAFEAGDAELLGRLGDQQLAALPKLAAVTVRAAQVWWDGSAPDRHDSEGSKRHASTIDSRGCCLTAPHEQRRAQHSHKALPALKLHRGCNVCPAGDAI